MRSCPALPLDTPDWAKWSSDEPLQKLYFTLRDVGMVVVDVALAMATKDMLNKQGVIPADIMK